MAKRFLVKISHQKKQSRYIPVPARARVKVVSGGLRIQKGEKMTKVHKGFRLVKSSSARALSKKLRRGYGFR